VHCSTLSAPWRPPVSWYCKKEKTKGKEKKGSEKNKERRKIGKINYLFFRNYYSQFILTIILFDNKNKM
jgi:hypothetical protein